MRETHGQADPYDPVWSERFWPTRQRPLAPLLARLRELCGKTGSRVAAHTAAEVQALATAAIALVLGQLLDEEAADNEEGVADA